jgi:hypothetical protein
MNDNTLYILFGFGGSGGKTIRHLADIMTNDPVAAKNAADRLHFVLCDTDVGEMRASADGIREAFRTKVSGMDPQVETFALGHGVDIFPDLVSSRVESTDADGLSRLKQHWWFQQHAGPEGNVDVPFSASRLPLSVSAGAGQCPMVSHFLAWDGLRRFEELLGRISMHAQNHRGMEDFHVELMFVAGLAGGTGRGCWQTLCLKTREYFGARQQSCRPTGFFFDASVFSDIQRGRPDQKVKLQINGLTGLSELAMWLRSDLDGTERRVSLPDLRNPADTRVDVIDTENYMPARMLARKGRCPVHRAYIFTKEGGVLLEDSGDAYKIAAAAIYGRFAVANTRSADANTPARACATATSVLYVPISDIRRCVQLRAKARRVEQFISGSQRAKESGGDSSKRTLAWLENLVSVPAHPQDFLQRAATHGRSSGHPSIAGMLGSRHVQDAQGAGKGVMAPFNKALESGDKNKISRQVDSLRSQSLSQVSLVFFNAVCSTLDIPENDEQSRGAHESDRTVDRAAELIWSRLVQGGAAAGGGVVGLQRLAGADSADSGSIGVLWETIQRLGSIIHDALKAIPESNREGDQNSAEAIASRLKVAIDDKRSSMGFLPLVPSYSDASRAALRDLASQLVVAARMPEYRNCFRDLLKGLETRVSRTAERLKLVMQAASQLQGSLGQQSDNLAKSVFLGFGANDERKILEELRREMSDPMNKIVRCLKPLADREAFEELVSNTLRDAGGGALYEERRLLEDLVKVAPDADSSVFATKPLKSTEALRYGDGLLERIRLMVDRQELPADLLRRFTVDRVLHEIVDRACAMYSKNAGDVAFRRELSEAIEGLTGIDLEELERRRNEQAKSDAARQNEALRAPSEPTIVAAAALQLATRCDPPVRVAGTREALGDLVSVLLPDLGTDASTQTDVIESVIGPMWRARPGEFRHVQVGKLEKNPYMVVAVSDLPKRDFEREGWSGWSTFDYWRGPEIQRWLQMVEDPEGASVFCTDDDSIGLGYISPLYVRDQHWASRRWRPWFDNRRVTAQTQRKWYALAYALLGNDPYRSDRSAGEEPWLRNYRALMSAMASKAKVNDQHPGELLKLPLLVERPGGDGPSFTRRLFVLEGGAFRQTGMDVRSSPGTFKSMRSFVEWFRSDESGDVLAKVWNEQPIMCAMLKHPDLYEVTSPAHRADANLALREYVREWREHVERNVTREDDRKNQVEFLAEFAKVISEPGFDVLQPFDAPAGT